MMFLGTGITTLDCLQHSNDTVLGNRLIYSRANRSTFSRMFVGIEYESDGGGGGGGEDEGKES